MRRPADYLPAFEEALRETVANQDPSFAKTMPLSTLKIGRCVMVHCAVHWKTQGPRRSKAGWTT